MTAQTDKRGLALSSGSYKGISQKLLRNTAPMCYVVHMPLPSCKSQALTLECTSGTCGQSCLPC